MAMPGSSDHYVTTLEDPLQRRDRALQYLQTTIAASSDDVLVLLIEKVRQLETELATLGEAHNAHNAH